MKGFQGHAGSIVSQTREAVAEGRHRMAASAASSRLAGEASQSTATKTQEERYSVAICSRKGAMALHGPHLPTYRPQKQAAQIDKSAANGAELTSPAPLPFRALAM